jgi:hypothetical protein
MHMDATKADVAYCQNCKQMVPRAKLKVQQEYVYSRGSRGSSAAGAGIGLGDSTAVAAAFDYYDFPSDVQSLGLYSSFISVTAGSRLLVVVASVSGLGLPADPGGDRLLRCDAISDTGLVTEFVQTYTEAGTGITLDALITAPIPSGRRLYVEFLFGISVPDTVLLLLELKNSGGIENVTQDHDTGDLVTLPSTLVSSYTNELLLNFSLVGGAAISAGNAPLTPAGFTSLYGITPFLTGVGSIFGYQRTVPAGTYGFATTLYESRNWASMLIAMKPS